MCESFSGTRRGVRTWTKPFGRARRRFVEGEKLRAASGQGLVRAEPALTHLSRSTASVLCSEPSGRSGNHNGRAWASFAGLQQRCSCSQK